MMTKTKSSRTCALVLAILLVGTFSAPSTTAIHGYLEHECDAGFFGLYVKMKAFQGHGEGAYARVEGWVNWIADGYDGPHEDEEEHAHSATAEIDIKKGSLDPDLAREAKGEYHGNAIGVGGRSGNCAHSSAGLNLTQLPDWVPGQLQAVGCSWTGGADQYGYSGELFYESAEENLYLKQSNDVVDLTATPLFSASSQTMSVMPQSSESTALGIDAFGNDSIACRHTLTEI